MSFLNPPAPGSVVTHSHVSPASTKRPELHPEAMEKYRSYIRTLTPRQITSMRREFLPDNTGDTLVKRVARTAMSNYYKDLGNGLFKKRDYKGAIQMYRLGIQSIVGDDMELPSRENEPKLYLSSDRYWSEYIDLTLCSSNISICYLKMEPRNLEQVLHWCNEVELLYLMQRPVKTLPWETYSIDYEEYFSTLMKLRARRAHILLELGNTGSATIDALSVHNIITLIDDPPLKLDKICDEVDLAVFTTLRHPDPAKCGQLEVTHPNFQVRGSWQKMKHRDGPGHSPVGRYCHSAFIWESRLYIGGGKRDDDTRDLLEREIHLPDLWYLPLTEGGKWHRMPDIPIQGMSRATANFTSRSMRVWKDVAYVFLGSPTVYAFDLKTEKWRRLSTVLLEGHWPYKHGELDNFAMQTYDNKLYVFGGTDFHRSLGTSDFMALDLSTLEWEHLGGSNRVEVIPKHPSFRQHPGSWIAEEEQKMYILFGGVNRTGAALGDSPYGSTADYIHGDMWSYSFATRQWEQERMFGNIPCPRTEHSTTFSTKLGRAVVFGGYSPQCPLMGAGEGDKRVNFDFSYYADTFVWDPKTNNWSQVLTRSFPTYRAQAQLLADNATGKLYLYAGYTNTAFAPAKSPMTHNFGDVWTLTIDLPGGNWQESDWTGSQSLGPWKKCDGCGSVGQWQKCGGTCGGKVHFCSKDCLRDKWAEHKAVTGCTKRR